MAIINSYPTVTPTSEDLLLISDVSEDGNPTKTVTISAIVDLIPPLVPGGGTMSSWKLTGDNAPIQSTVSDGNTVDIEGGTKITTAAAATTKVTINHDATTRTDTASASSPGYAGTFTCIDSITQDATGHPTAVNVKTVTIPAEPTADYLVYSALITQTGTSAPTAIVLKNTIPGTSSWVYSNPGEYALKNSGTPFTANKVLVFVNRGEDDTFSDPIRWAYGNTSEIFIKTADSTGSPANALITNGSIEVRIYS